MDPNRCWSRINAILSSDENVDDAARYIAALDGWLSNGGFPPDNFDPDLFECMKNWIKTGCKSASHAVKLSK